MNSNITDVYTLTPLQEGIYAQYFQNTDTKTYRFQILCRINKEADLGLVKKSVELLSLRHQVLKTAFAVLKSTGAIKQVIVENRKFAFNVLKQDEPFSQKALDKIVGEDARKSLDLQRDPLMRITVIDFNDERYMLTHTHHIILDGWSFPIIINDLQKYYDKLSKGMSEEELSEEIRQELSHQTSFAQYVNWLKSQDKNESSEYWQNLLADCNFAHIFDKEKKHNVKNENIATFRTHLSSEISQNIEKFAKKNRISHNTVFETAFSVALQKFSGSNDVVFDKVISGRNIPLKNIENTVGLFVNTVPVRIRSNENSTLADLLKETQDQTVNSNKYGILPLTDIYKTCDINGNAIDALFVFENYYLGDITDISKGPLSPELIFFNEQTEFNLSIAVFRENNEHIIRTSYASEVYSEREMSEFTKGYISVLEAHLDETKLIKDISVADTDVVDEFNSTAHSYDIHENSTLYSFFEKTAKENADKICIKTAENNLIFGELSYISGKLDAHLRKITDGEKSVIAVIAERSEEMYGAVYGIIRGGNAYLPIDPSYPQERIDYILENSNAAAVVAQGKFAHLAGNVPCIDMTAFIKNANDNTGEIPECAAEPNDTAYVIYTSGSTGNPKGAKVSHKSAVNRILWMHDKYPLGTYDVILQKTPYTFDVSVWEIFWWGICGGSLAPSRPGEHFLPAKILDEVQRQKVTHLHFVPSVFELFLNYIETHTEEVQKFDSVRYVFLSGEALSAELVQRFYKLYDYEKITLHNLYGPTECAVDVTYYDCLPSDTDPVPIGKPIYNTQIHIVDKYLKPVPIGVTGELCIAGDNVGQGYLNNPELTAERFIDNPFGKGKLYRTGDNAYWREDGNIVFCGRSDFQVKINGQRIEISEIEAVIGSVINVESAAVIVKRVNGKDILIAFYTGKSNCEEAIREYCSNRLPKYMIPSVITHLDRLPLNHNGKLDRKKLTEIKVSFAKAEQNDEPENETEKQICKTFEDVLKTGKIGRNSDFFDMGGSSISMISVLSEDGFENITASEFIRNSTPSKLAGLMLSKRVNTYEYLEPLYLAENSERAIVLLPFAGGKPEVYSNFVRALKNRNDRISVYFIRYLHSPLECEKAAEEIMTTLSKKEITIYSHCVGSAVALYILNKLEKEQFSVMHYYAGASIPPEKPKKNNIWNIVPDLILKCILMKAGADFKALPGNKVKSLLKSFRADTDFSNVTFFEFDKRLSTPISIVVSKKDIFTKNFSDAKKLWLKYFKEVAHVRFINSESHYFQRDNAEELIQIICDNK